MAQEEQFMGSCKIKSQILKEFLGELIGTFILVLVCDCSIATQLLSSHGVNVLAIGFATGMALMVSFYSVARLSGSHVNPAVTLGLFSIGKFPAWKIPHYLAGQYVGGFLATALAYANHYQAITQFDKGTRSAYFTSTASAGIFASHPQEYLGLGNIALDQIICVGLLQFGILCIVDHNNLNCPKPLMSVALFILLAGLICAFGLQCGPALNPARDLAARLFAYIVGYGPEVWNPAGGWYWLIGGVIGPHVGAIIGSWFYHFTVGLNVEPEPQPYIAVKTDDIVLREVK